MDQPRNSRSPVRGAERAGEVFAAIDLGTNNCRLLVARPEADEFRVIDAFSRIVRLGEGLVDTNRLSEAAMQRTIDALRICASKIRRNKTTHVRAVATEACRRAENGAEFIARAEQEAGIQLEIIEPREEARLALIGCAPLYAAPSEPDSFALLFDIGGGSTQVTWLRLDPPLADGAPPQTTVLDYVSLPCGVVTLSERFRALETPAGQVDPQSYADVCAHVGELLEPFEQAHNIAAEVAAGRVQMVGTSGTVTTLTGVLLDLPRYDRSQVDGRALTFDDLERGRDRLIALDRQGRVAHPCIGPQRADLVIAGCAVLDAICTAWPVGNLRAADRGLREGILHGLMQASDRETALAG